MRTFQFASLAILPLLIGCGQNVYTLGRQNQALHEQQQALALRNQELQTRATQLDQNNQQRDVQLAQSKQQLQLLQDELTAVRDQLRGTSQQLAELRRENHGLEKHTQAMAASVRQRSQATIRANNSLVGDLTLVHVPGVQVRQDGDVVRVELPGTKLFQPGSASLLPDSLSLLDRVMADLLRNYPDQIIGVEGHTDTDPIRTPQFPSNHHLATGRAVAVFDYVTRRYQVPSKQMFVVGHGANHPVVSNATDAGKARNRRVELVIYPDGFRK